MRAAITVDAERPLASARHQYKFFYLCALLLLLIWSVIWYDLVRSREIILSEARVQLHGQARVFAQYASANVKRLNEALLDLRGDWKGDTAQFADLVRHRQGMIDDLLFQVAIIDKEGILLFSNLGRPTERTDLRTREHFLAHQRAPDKDALFISNPVKGKVSGKWSLQFTRPLLKNGRFDGVIVISVSPELFSDFASQFASEESSTFVVLKYDGTLMACSPVTDFSTAPKVDMSDYLAARRSGSDTIVRASTFDHAERMLGFHFLPDYQMVFVSGERMDVLLRPYQAGRDKRLALASVLSAGCLWLCYLLDRTARARQRISQRLVERERVLRESQEFARIGSYGYHSATGQFSLSAIAEEIVGARTNCTLATLLRMITPAHRRHALSELKEAVRQGAPFTVAYPVRRQNNGVDCWIEARGYVDHAAAPDAAHVLGVVQDITERKKYEQLLQDNRSELETLVVRRTADLTSSNATLQKTLADLARANSHLIHSEKMASIGQLAAGVAHEINNPIGFVISNMNSLRGYLDKLMNVIAAHEQAAALVAGNPVAPDADLDYIRDDIGDLLRESDEGLQRVKKIVQNMKDFAHAGEGQWQQADLHHGIVTTLNIVASELKFKANIVKDFGTLPLVACMATELNQVFLNILMNAGHAIAHGGQITIATGVAGKEVWISIADNGAGMPPQVVKRIFEPFYTTKPVGVGTGLGLSISYSIIEQHRGRIEVSSTVGVGTRFCIHLPIERAPALPLNA
ncbi:ATP-binding protein [Massilia sp. PWRC2]|uniref:ATP-binding protein n=1 Tax=Massilia sp. PWRC2 TaxID=2804626 RepID=UPI003CE73247